MSGARHSSSPRQDRGIACKADGSAYSPECSALTDAIENTHRRPQRAHTTHAHRPCCDAPQLSDLRLRWFFADSSESTLKTNIPLMVVGGIVKQASGDEDTVCRHLVNVGHMSFLESFRVLLGQGLLRWIGAQKRNIIPGKRIWRGLRLCQQRDARTQGQLRCTRNSHLHPTPFRDEDSTIRPAGGIS